jgi:hypothetical protein
MNSSVRNLFLIPMFLVVWISTGAAQVPSTADCVFHCNDPKEALWRVLTAIPADGGGRGMNRSCDLFIPPEQ